MKRRAIYYLIEIASLLVLHVVLILWLAETNTVATIFAAGRHVPPLTLATAGLFVLARLLAVLFLPGLILSRLGMLAFDWWKSRQP